MLVEYTGGRPSEPRSSLLSKLVAPIAAFVIVGALALAVFFTPLGSVSRDVIRQQAGYQPTPKPAESSASHGEPRAAKVWRLDQHAQLAANGLGSTFEFVNAVASGDGQVVFYLVKVYDPSTHGVTLYGAILSMTPDGQVGPVVVVPLSQAQN